MLEDIFNIPCEIKINSEKFKAEYDFNSYAVLETLTGKGFYKLYNLLMVQNNLTLNDSVEIVCCSLLKHHSEKEVEKVREYLHKNPYAIQDLNSSVIGVFVAPMLDPEIIKTVQGIKKKVEKIQIN